MAHLTCLNNLFISRYSISVCLQFPGEKLEIALTGTALPVYFSILPSPCINFEDCVVGNIKEETVRLRNDSPDLPLCFAIRRVAHFHTRPSCGYIETSQIKDLNLYFQPNQIGQFKCKLLLEVIDQVCTLNGSHSPIYKKRVIGTHDIIVKGCSPSVTGAKHSYSQSARKNRLLHDTASSKTLQDPFSNLNASLEVLNSKETQSIHSSVPVMKKREIVEEEIPVYIAHPNDLACSIRPSNPNERIRYCNVVTDISFNVI